MKKLKKIILGLILLLCISNIMACKPESVSINVSDNDGNFLSNNEYGIENLQPIGGGLYYDFTTEIVYFWNGHYNAAYYSTMPTPYYSPNGKLFKYNRFKKVFIEVEDNNSEVEKKKGHVYSYEYER